MSMRVMRISQDGEIEGTTMEAGEQLDKLQGFVGGNVECIQLAHTNGSALDLWINEVGTLDESQKLNAMATVLVHTFCSAHRHENTLIFGHVAIATSNDEGETTGLPQDVFTAIGKMFRRDVG